LLGNTQENADNGEGDVQHLRVEDLRLEGLYLDALRGAATLPASRAHVTLCGYSCTQIQAGHGQLRPGQTTHMQCPASHVAAVSAVIAWS
jgi:hypothetical protein